MNCFCILCKLQNMHKFLPFILLVFSLTFILALARAKSDGFSIELIHRDSPLSPLYNHSKSPLELLKDASLRSLSRTKHFKKTLFDQKDIESIVIPNGGDYLMKISIGTPPVQAFAVADTGSDLIWVQCQPCEQCYQQDNPIFDPKRSSTYKELSCASQPCEALPRKRCGNSNECQYQYSYGDGSSTIGALTTETLSFNSSSGEVASFPNSVFGCGRNNEGKFNSLTSGIVGLGQGTLSLVSQLGSGIGNKFSYCLLPRSAKSSSKLKFGREATIRGNSIVSTPFTTKSNPTFYYLTLEGISVGDRTLQLGQGQGNIIIDSGTTLTYLESNFYNSLQASLQEAIGIEPIQDTSGTFNLCYRDGSVNSPELVFHFAGADLHLPSENTFITFDDLMCLTIVPGDDASIFGNIAQVNFQVEYDLDARKVSFAPTDCSKL